MAKVLGTRPWEVWRLGVSFGRLQARLHQIALPPELSTSHGADWAGMVEDAALTAAVRTAAGPAVFCHGDYHPLNVLVRPPRITGLIDFMNAMAADRRADLGITHTILTAAPLEPGPLQPVLQVARHLFARAWRQGYRSRAGSFPLDPLFEAWGAAYYLRGLENAVRDGRGWATAADATRLHRIIDDRKRAAGLSTS
jgi:aminoglycoside phosphotransferase (APT) family kinase protein